MLDDYLSFPIQLLMYDTVATIARASKFGSIIVEGGAGS